MAEVAQWLADLGGAATHGAVDGLVPVAGYVRDARPPEEVAVMEKAQAFGADAVFFEAERNDRAPVAQAFIFISNGPADDPDFGEIHRRLWSWGGVPLLYRKTAGCSFSAVPISLILSQPRAKWFADPTNCFTSP